MFLYLGLICGHIIVRTSFMLKLGKIGIQKISGNYLLSVYYDKSPLNTVFGANFDAKNRQLLKADYVPLCVYFKGTP